MILCTVQLRLALPVTDLCYRFNISKTTTSRIFLETLNIFFVRLKLLMYWPDPPDRAKFRTKISVIIDCFEIFIERSSNLTARHLTWSSYKQHSTIKYLIGITPQGTISFNSESWSGCASDQRNTQNSNFLSKLTDGYTLPSVILTDGLRQRYSILEQTIPITFLGVSDNTTTLDKIVVVSCYLVNLCPSVVLFE